MRKVPGAPAEWLGLTQWSGQVLSVLDLPALLGDSGEHVVTCLLRPAAPHDGIALYLPARIDLVYLEGPVSGSSNGTVADCEAAGDPIRWIEIDRLVDGSRATRADR